jgi:LacI family transcriptional regulator
MQRPKGSDKHGEDTGAERARVTIRKIAEVSGVSKSLVSLALRNDGRVAAATQQRVRKVAADLGYETNALVSRLMAELRSSRKRSFQANLALINCSPNKRIFEWHTFRDFRLGIQEGARNLGYVVDDFWMWDTHITPSGLTGILRARQIPGVLFVGAADPDMIDGEFDVVWRNFPAVALGIEKTNPQIACVCADHYQTAKEAVDQVLARGYRKPGLTLEGKLDRLVDRRFSGGFLAATQDLPASRRVPVHFADLTQPATFRAWFERHRPDCILTIHDGILEWVAGWEDSASLPVGLVHMDWHEGVADYAGMVQSNRSVGRIAAELLVQHIHANLMGAPEHPQVTLVESRWRDGPSIRSGPG